MKKRKNLRKYWTMGIILIVLSIVFLSLQNYSKGLHKITADKNGCFQCWTCPCTITIDDKDYKYSGVEKDYAIKCFELINKGEWRYNKQSFLMLNENEFSIFEDCLKSSSTDAFYCELDSDCRCCDFIESSSGKLHENVCVNDEYTLSNDLICGGIESTDSFCYTHDCKCVNNKCVFGMIAY